MSEVTSTSRDGSEKVRLRSGALMPRVGFGTFRIDDKDAEGIVSDALAQGFRLIDTAQGYGNERGVGRALAASALPRAQVFVTTKVSNDNHGRVATRSSVLESIERVGSDYLDLVLIHWPLPHLGLAVETWEELSRLRQDGLIRDIGLSNFTGRHLDPILATGIEPPAVHQIEAHPFFPQPDAQAVNEANAIVTQSWSALAQGNGLLESVPIVHTAREVGVSPAQIVLRWHIQRGLAPLVKTRSPERMRLNLDVFRFDLSDDQMRRIATLDRAQRVGPDPDLFGSG
ncbi:aldo/keto reductase [Dactylosporangium sp. CA-233914]|uniref:aldo/keto reductase n=1 Tax=Dactylosporangium sp. CA-233914 TaxID=3239934 RepID=UPI003D8AB110